MSHTDSILYLCGPMTGLPSFNTPAFHAAAQALRSAGYMVINPAENGLPPDAPWQRHMRRDIALMVETADAVAILPGAENSRGAQIETTLAAGLGWPIWSVEMWLAMAEKEATA